MILINLLPYREVELQKNREQFKRLCVLIVILCVVASGFLYLAFKDSLDKQIAKNIYLQNDLNFLQNQVKDIEKMEQTIKQLNNKVLAINSLNLLRNQVVDIFNEVNNILPASGIYINSFSQKDSSISIDGNYYSEDRVSELLFNISEHSELFTNAQLLEISDVAVNEGIFKMNFSLKDK